jgi:signal transduction histidine kinase
MDHDWVDAGTRRAAYYSQLPPGEYQFQVMVGGFDREWHAAERVVRLRVIPRLWERRSVQVLAGGVLIGIAAGGLAWSQRRRYRLHLERLEMQNAVENERRRIARDLHDEFGSALSGIMLQGEAAVQAPLPQAAQSVIVSITERVRRLIVALDEVVWTTDPRNDSLPRVVAYLCDYAESFLSPTGINFRLDAPAPAELPAINLTAPQRHNLLLATKESLNNAVRHARARTIGLKMRIQDHALVVQIWDNGRGFDPKGNRSSGNGLSNLESRMKLLQGSAEIRSRAGEGTTVTLAVPLRTASTPKTSDQGRL